MDEGAGQGLGAVKGVVGDRQWMVDRIIRTETAAIYNGTALAAMEAEDTPDDPMFKRLVSIFDNVTGADSYGQHGQIRRVRDPFQDSKGRLYQAPPNRPHDRAVVIPHRGSWGERVEHLERVPVDVVAETSEPAPLPKPPRRPCRSASPTAPCRMRRRLCCCSPDRSRSAGACAAPTSRSARPPTRR